MDWQYYQAYGLLGESHHVCIQEAERLPAIRLGERAFEITLARAEGADAVDPEFVNDFETPARIN